MNIDQLKAIRLNRQKPANVINLNLCKNGVLPEPVIRLEPNQDIDYRVFHNLALDIHFWSRGNDVMKLVDKLMEVSPKTISIVNHKIKSCIMVYFKNNRIVDDQSFLFDFERVNPYAT